MTVPEAVAAVRSQMASAASPEHAVGLKWFFKEQVNPWGVRSAALTQIERSAYRMIKPWPKADRNKFCDHLWHGKYEEGVLVCHVYRRFEREFSGCEWKLFERWIDRYVKNWAHCDGVASWLLAACIANEPALKDNLPAWTASKNRWKRRASAVALLQEAKKGRNTEAIFDIAIRLREDQDDLVQKGVGWVLKETYPKQPEAIIGLLAEVRFARPVVRYAAEKMTLAHRQAAGL